MSKANDLLGKRFGKLTVVLRAGSDKKGNSLKRQYRRRGQP